MRRERMNVAVTAGVLALAMVAAADTIAVRASVRSAGGEVRLAEVAELTGPEAVALGDVVVAKGGAAGVELEAIRGALDERKVNWARLSLVGHSRCELIQPKTEQAKPKAEERQEPDFEPCAKGTVGGEMLKLAAGMAGAAAEEMRISLSAQDRALARRVIGADRYELEPQGRAPGRVPVVVRRFQGGRLVETQHVSAVVQQRVVGVVATRALPRRQMVKAEDVRLAELWLVEKPAEPVTDVSVAVGQVTARGLREGEMITVGALVPPVLVERGEPVTVYCATGGLLIKVTGTAMEEGAAGGVIRVRNEASREEFWAEVTGPRQAVARVDGAAGQGLAEEAEARP